MTKTRIQLFLVLLLCSSSLLAQNGETPRHTSVVIDALGGSATVTVEDDLAGNFSTVQRRVFDPNLEQANEDWVTISANSDGIYRIDGRGHFEIRFSVSVSVHKTSTSESIVVWTQRIYIPYPAPDNTRELAESYLPIPVFNAEEEYFPVSLDEILSFGGPAPDQATPEQVTVSRLEYQGPQTVGAGDELKSYLAHNGHPDYAIYFDKDDVTCPRQDPSSERDSDCSHVFYRDLYGDDEEITVYYDASVEEGSLYLTYYYFYAFDPKVEGDQPENDDGERVELNDFAHVYDRESVTIRLDRENETDAWRPRSVTYAAHLESQDMEFNGCNGNDFTNCDEPDGNNPEHRIWGGGKTQLAWDQALKVGQHPVIYLAKGSHAVLPAVGWYTVRTAKVIQGLEEPAGGVGDGALVIPERSTKLKALAYDDLGYLSFSGGWITVDVPILGDRQGYFPPFVRTPYRDWLEGVDTSFFTCLSDPAPTGDCKAVAEYFESVRGLENYAAVTFRVLEPVDESVHPVQYIPQGGAELRIFEDGELLDNLSGETTALGEYTLIFQPKSSSAYTYEVRIEEREVLGSLDGVETGVVAIEEIYFGAVDSDGDGAPDTEDAFPDDPEEQFDTDDDGVGDNADAFPGDPQEQIDTDGDGVGNNADIDDDGDNVPDEFDVFPLDDSEWSDYDNDGVGDNADPPEGAPIVHVEIVSTNTLNIYWSMPPDYVATSFEMYRDQVVFLTTTGSSYIDSGLNEDTYYCYSVIATLDTGELSPPSSISCGKTNSTSVPVDVTASAGNAQSVISWNAVEGASAYAVYWGNEPGVSLASANRVEVSSDTYLHEGLTNNRSYFYVVTSLVDGFESTKSVEVMAVPRNSSLLNKFLFGTQRDGNWEIYTADAPSGDNMVNLTLNPADDQLAKIAPTLDRIAFVSDRDGNREVYAMEVDGTLQIRFTNDFSDDAPSDWSPDASELLVMTNRDNNLEIYKYDRDGVFLARLTENTEDDTLATWAPDSSRVLYVSEVDGNPEIYTMLPNGEGKINLTNDSADDNIPFYSPDGRQITFVSDRDGDYDLYIMNADGTNLRKLTGDEIDEVGWYAWSPDGSRIVYDSRSDGDYEVYMISGNGTVHTRLTDNDFADQFASWTLDGRSILFITDRDGNSEIYIMDAEGGDALNVTNDPADDFIPVFSPIYGTITCFIATAAYGSPLHQDIQVLREFRDDHLMKSSIGRSFVDFYYEVSPPMAAYIAEREWLRSVTRGLLVPIVFVVRNPLGGIFLGLALFGVGTFGIRRMRLARKVGRGRTIVAG